jgi:ATP/maltotriose-dependent transcriptional regulator MalT/two-component SAPR family response regulator
MVTSNPEFVTKCIIPKRGEHVIARRRLIDLLLRHVDKRVQALSAPAGYGKTTLLIDFASELEVPVCWYSLDPADRDSNVLIEGIVNSIRGNFPGFGQATLERLALTGDPSQSSRALAGTLTGEINETIPDFLVLVLDDYHNVQDSPSSRDLLDLIIERAPENLHLVISSRAAIDLPVLNRLKLQNEVSSLNMADLAFNSGEVRDLLDKSHGLNLNEKEAGELAAKTEGWIVGILLSSYVLHGNKSSDQVFGLSHEDVFRYLGGEVYLKQPTEIREFLLGSSTLETMDQETCDALLGQSGSLAMLRDLEKRSLFVQCIDGSGASFRYHALFREFLQRTLLVENRSLFVSLHSSAAKLAERAGLWQDAIQHYLTANNFTEAKSLVVRVGPEYIKSGKWTTVTRWIEALPEPERSSSTDLTILFSQSLIHLGENGRAAGLLTQALSRSTAEADWLFRSKALSWRSAALRITGHFKEAASDIEEALAILNSHESTPDILGDAYRRLGTICAEQGQFQVALSHFERALDLYSSLLDVGQMADIHNSVGILYKRLGKLDEASVHFEKARGGWLETKNYGALAATLANVGYIYQRVGQFSLAIDTIDSGIEKARATGYRRVEACLLIARAEVLRDLDRYDEALDSYNMGLDIAREVGESYYVIWAKAGLGETYRLTGDCDRAEILIKEAISQANSQGQGYDSAIFATQLGIIEYERGHLADAERILEEVCSRLETMGDRDGLAKAHFHLAQAAFLEKNYDRAMEHLKTASGLADGLGYDAFFAVEGRKAVLLMEYAVSEGLDVERFSKALSRIKLHRVENDTKNRSGNHQGLARKPEIEAFALGETSVALDARPIAESQWRSLRAREILFFLLSSDRSQTRESVTAAVWPDLSPAKATSNFHINLFRLRKALHPRIITMEQGRYLINPNLEVWFDVTEFEKLVRVIDNADLMDAELIPTLEKAASLYKGEFLAEVFSDWALEKRRTLENQYVKVLILLSRLSSNRGQHNRALNLLEKLTVIDPYRDETYCQLIEEYLAMGNDVAASGIYKRYVETVAREMDCVPSAHMRSLYKRILTNGPNKN